MPLNKLSLFADYMITNTHKPITESVRKLMQRMKQFHNAERNKTVIWKLMADVIHKKSQ